MNTGQLLLTIGGMFLLAMLVLRVNKTYLCTSDIMYNSKYGILATSVATSFMEEASSKQFDNKTKQDCTSTDSLTAANKLGPETGEVYPNFDDFDDYNSLNRTDNSMPSAVFNISCRVCYVQPNLGTGQLTEVTSKTWYKKLEVTVTSPSWKKSNGTLEQLTLSFISSYWYER
jgi:hypothetical protein